MILTVLMHTGYDTDSPHAYRIYWPCANKVSVERNVKIIEVFADDEATSKMYVPKSTNDQTVPVSHPPQPSTQEKPEELP